MHAISARRNRCKREERGAASRCEFRRFFLELMILRHHKHSSREQAAASPLGWQSQITRAASHATELPRYRRLSLLAKREQSHFRSGMRIRRKVFYKPRYFAPDDEFTHAAACRRPVERRHSILYTKCLNFMLIMILRAASFRAVARAYYYYRHNSF